MTSILLVNKSCVKAVHSNSSIGVGLIPPHLFDNKIKKIDVEILSGLSTPVSQNFLLEDLMMCQS